VNPSLTPIHRSRLNPKYCSGEHFWQVKNVRQNDILHSGEQFFPSNFVRQKWVFCFGEQGDFSYMVDYQL
jgi:hypothetical protein